MPNYRIIEAAITGHVPLEHELRSLGVTRVEIEAAFHEKISQELDPKALIARCTGIKFTDASLNGSEVAIVKCMEPLNALRGVNVTDEATIKVHEVVHVPGGPDYRSIGMLARTVNGLSSLWRFTLNLAAFEATSLVQLSVKVVND